MNPLRHGLERALQRRHLPKRRRDRKVQHHDVAKHLGVCESSVYNWKNNRSHPSLRSLPRIIEFLGYSPADAPPKTLGERIIAYRTRHGLSEAALVASANIPRPMTG
jgi:DNA-binding XRE family transcriptional regulator